MKKLMNGAQMKMIDTYSIQEVGIPSLVLMERAALCVTEAVLEKIKKTDKVLCVCGSGNNGADRSEEHTSELQSHHCIS